MAPPTAAGRTRGFYVPSEQALSYAAAGFDIVDDLRPNEVFVIPRVHDDSAPKAEARDGP